jgi:hypothetical protein
LNVKPVRCSGTTVVTGVTVDVYPEKFEIVICVPVDKPALGLTVYILSTGPIDSHEPG